MIVYHNIYQNEEGLWCVDYTENNTLKIACFQTNEEAANFYMKTN